MKKSKDYEEKQKGITLIALIVTIIILIILATVSVSMVVNNNLIDRAKEAKQLQANAVASEGETLEELVNEYDSIINSSTPTPIPTLDVSKLPKGPNGKPLVSGVTKTEHDTITGEDNKGNQVVIPGGFKLASDSGTTVQEGIVVEDANQNQFVWIPVSNIDHSGSNKIKIEQDGVESEVEITLGRYTFDESTGVETKVQYGSEYAATTLDKVKNGEVDSYKTSGNGSYYYEVTDKSESNQLDDLTGTNTTAKDLKEFIESVRDNRGYYIARYEASYSSGSEFGVGESATYYKPASKKSIAASDTAMNYIKGTLWNFITQGNAAKASRQMYYGNSYVESDLANSYAWDTAIVYIQGMGNANYANQKDGNGTIKNTGETGDQKCKIFDMAANVFEWTTGYSTFTVSIYAYPCTVRGGSYSFSDVCTRGRYYNTAAISPKDYSFRPLLYCKTGA